MEKSKFLNIKPPIYKLKDKKQSINLKEEMKSKNDTVVVKKSTMKKFSLIDKYSEGLKSSKSVKFKNSKFVIKNSHNSKTYESYNLK